ncbi:MAG: capsule biosynthesis GfcC family protein, partial [Mariprofundales bacterium]|nr:capsule biosynthesis GfcC family protein [Mariprofundales bacterium]
WYIHQCLNEKLCANTSCASFIISISIKDGDRLFVPKRPDQVMVMGQTYNNTSLIYQKQLDRDDYIGLAGGTTAMADESRIYIVKADGTVVASSSGWSRRGKRVDPGDTIVVPQKLDELNILDSALDWSKVLMQIGVGVASMKTIGII